MSYFCFPIPPARQAKAPLSHLSSASCSVRWFSSHWRLNHFYSFLLDRGSRAGNKHFLLGRVCKSETPTCLALSKVRITPSGQTQFLQMKAWPALHNGVRATSPYGQVHLPHSVLSQFSREQSACCAGMLQDGGLKHPFGGTNTA